MPLKQPQNSPKKIGLKKQWQILGTGSLATDFFLPLSWPFTVREARATLLCVRFLSINRSGKVSAFRNLITWHYIVSSRSNIFRATEVKIPNSLTARAHVLQYFTALICGRSTLMDENVCIYHTRPMLFIVNSTTPFRFCRSAPSRCQQISGFVALMQ